MYVATYVVVRKYLRTTEVHYSFIRYVRRTDMNMYVRSYVRSSYVPSVAFYVGPEDTSGNSYLRR